MAVPRITRLLPYGAALDDPVVGPTRGGQLVEIYGGNYRLPPAPQVLDPTASVPRTVRVRFGGKDSPGVAVIRGNLLRVFTPPSPVEAGPSVEPRLIAEGKVDVEVENLDDLGEVIPGEVADRPDAYEFRLPRLDDASLSNLAYLTQEVILDWRRNVFGNTLHGQSIEFVDEPGAFRRLALAKTPALVVFGPRTTRSPFYQSHGAREVPAARVLGLPRNALDTVARQALALDLGFDVRGVVGGGTGHGPQLTNLMHVAVDYLHRTDALVIPRCPGSAETIEYDLRFEPGGEFAPDDTPDDSDVLTFSGSFVVRGFQLEGLRAFFGDRTLATAPTLETVQLSTERQ